MSGRGGGEGGIESPLSNNNNNSPGGGGGVGAKSGRARSNSDRVDFLLNFHGTLGRDRTKKRRREEEKKRRREEEKKRRRKPNLMLEGNSVRTAHIYTRTKCKLFTPGT
jgi:hypothetical protein